ncbi:MAG: hypothetical protein HYZ73_08455 [Elusimicrobia bacterium]|nr:hypothetical protein [Elusimicrobiota bacterium]
MSEYSRRDDWQVNQQVKIELTKRGVDVSSVTISTIKGIVDIQGDLRMTSKLNQDVEPLWLAHFLKQLDLVLRGIYRVRDVRWQIEGWRRQGFRWMRSAPSRSAIRGSS